MIGVTKLFSHEFPAWNDPNGFGMMKFTLAVLAIRLRAATTFIEK
jgi:hypothetical protein